MRGLAFTPYFSGLNFALGFSGAELQAATNETAAMVTNAARNCVQPFPVLRPVDPQRFFPEDVPANRQVFTPIPSILPSYS
ncbi:MAG: hypothetical protein RDA78_21460 [Roseibium sp.]|uniref:hypothetical protein n=1 Tax=Roseibium sp. TaxID=1936156 RepID=UPI003D9C2652